MPWRHNLKLACESASWFAVDDDLEEQEQPQLPKSPQCPRCNCVMYWWKSELKRNGRTTIVHSFHCLKCGEVASTEEPLRQALRAVA